MRKFIETSIITVTIILIVGAIAYLLTVWLVGSGDPQTIEQKLDVIIELLEKEREMLRIPVLTDENDKKAIEYGKQFQEEGK